MYPRSFLCEEAKIKQRTALNKELCEIGDPFYYAAWARCQKVYFIQIF